MSNLLNPFNYQQHLISPGYYLQTITPTFSSQTPAFPSLIFLSTQPPPPS